jgi:hypothetical protein
VLDDRVTGLDTASRPRGPSSTPRRCVAVRSPACRAECAKAINQEVVLAALSRFKDIYAKLPPYQRRELIGLVLLKAEVTENQLRLSFHGRPAAPEVFEKISAPGARASRRAEPFEWLRTRSATRTLLSG